ncbi:MAG: tetratricopeptide repeat protein [Bacteroidota bacterium]|nr:tetratricopeptide repeat protein [Bacteroidota bacterium]
MIGAKKLRIALIAGAVVLAAGVYLLPKKPLPKSAKEAKEVVEAKSAAFSFDKFLSDSKIKVGWAADNKISTWEKSVKASDSNLALYDSIGQAWDAAQIPGVAAWYFEQKAEKTRDEKDWLNSSYRYFDAFKAAKDSTEASFFVARAVSSYTKVLELNPKNLNAKTDLGILYAEGTSEPMTGIKLLREVVTEDPKHENAHLNLGFLSMKSGQFDKAAERFRKVIEINPARIDMYVYLGEAYVRQGNKEKAIESFEVFKNLSNDQQMIKDVDDYIASLKSGK